MKKYIKDYFTNVIDGCVNCFLVERKSINTFYVEWEHAAMGLIKKNYLIKDCGAGLHIESI